MVKYVEAPPEAYTRQELEDLFRVSDEEEKFLWRFFLGTGFREAEVSVAEVTDVNRDTKTIRVDEKLCFGFKRRAGETLAYVRQQVENVLETRINTSYYRYV